MTLTRPNPLLFLVAVAVVFAGAVAALSALNPATRDPRPATSPIDDADARAIQAAKFLQQVRATGDPAYYLKAEAVLEPARRTPGVLTELGTLALSRHHFREG